MEEGGTMKFEIKEAIVPLGGDVDQPQYQGGKQGET